MPVRKPKVIAIVAALLAAWAAAPPARGADAPWWDDAWQYRLIVRVPPTDLRGGINTARVDLAEQSALCAKDGADLRVLDETGRAIPHTVDPRDGGAMAVKFLVPDGPELFYVYYGNPQAPPTRHGWEERLGGLTLETRSITTHIQRAGQIPALLRQRLKSYGKKPWREISDLSNPFGADDRYLSIYEGAIHCPEDGEYTFSLNADDVALFRLRRGSATMLYLQRDGGVPSEQWPEPDPRARTGPAGKAALRRGVYRLTYYHVENTGAQLAKLGWQRPSSGAIVTVPARAFVDHLPVDIEGRQARGAAQNPFFVAEHKYNLLVNSE